MNEMVFKFLEFMSSYFILLIFGGVIVLTVIRIIYKAFKSSTKNEAKKMLRGVANIYDPITGLPRNIVGKEQEVYIEEEYRDKD